MTRVPWGVWPNPLDSTSRVRYRRRLAALGVLLAAAIAASCTSPDSPPLGKTNTPMAIGLTEEPESSATRLATPRVAVTQTPAPTPTPRRPDATPFSDELRRLSQELLLRVAAQRDSPPKAQIELFLLSRGQARDFYSPDPAAEGGASELPIVDVKQEIYDLLGLVQKTEEIREAEIDNLISFITGFYSPQLGALYLLDEINGGTQGPLAQSTLVHELTHALQNQYYNLNSIAATLSNNWDAMTALLDVIEGDAVATEIEVLGFSTRSTYRNPVCFAIPAPQRPGTPFIIERELDTWYEDGLCFVQAVLAEKPGGIAAIFRDLPTTTEQILHPEKYLVGEDAKPVTLVALAGELGADWRFLDHGTFGEFTLQNILLHGLPDERTKVLTAAAGWGGDGWRFYSDGNSRLLQSTIVWDSVEEAREFWDAFVESILRRALETSPPSAVDSLEISLDGHFWQVAIQAAEITILVADDAATLERAAAIQSFP